MAEQRLIDANNLIEEIREERCYNCRNFKDMKCDYCGTADYIYMIEDMPTADVAPVVHGRWIYKGDSDMWVCSRCGRSVNADPEGIDLYCYHCGAKMDEKEDKHEDYT